MIHPQRGSFTAEAAAGLYMEERQATAKSLMLLLSDAIQHDLGPQDQPRWVCRLTDFTHLERPSSTPNHPSSPPACLRLLQGILSQTWPTAMVQPPLSACN